MKNLSTREDRFDKADEAFKKACADVNSSYVIWAEACDRLMRVGKERLAAWEDLVDPVLSVVKNTDENASKTADE